MAIMDEITYEKSRLNAAVYRSKLGKKITDDILIPILDQLKNDVPNILEETAGWIRDRIIEYLESVTPSGKTYKIYEYDASAPYGQRSTRLIREYKASAKGQPPGRLTGTLIDSIDYEIFSSGSFKVGMLKSWGDSAVGTEFESAFFKGGKIFVSADPSYNVQTPVGKYFRYLEFDPGTHPWFIYFMNSIRTEYKEKLRENARKSLKKITRRISVRKAVVFRVYFE